MRDRETRILAISFEPLHLALPQISPEALDSQVPWVVNSPFCKGSGLKEVSMDILLVPVGLVLKNPPAHAGDIRDASWSLGGNDPLEEGMAPHSSIFARRIPMDMGTVQATVHRVAKSLIWLMRLRTAHSTSMDISPIFSSFPSHLTYKSLCSSILNPCPWLYEASESSWSHGMSKCLSLAFSA